MSGFRGSRSARPTWRTWAGTVRCTPLELVTPASERAVVHAVARARANGLKVRAAGTGHSFNPLACTDGILLDLSTYAGVVDIDVDARAVTVRAGTTLWQVSRALEREGLALASLGSLADQTVGGAVSTGNHGSGIAHPPLAGEITALRLVTADGTVRQLDRAKHADAFRCARTALGALGVITEVTLRCVPRFNLRAVERREPLDGLLYRLGEVTTSADHVSFSWHAWSDHASVRSLHVTDEPPTRNAVRRRYASTLQEVRCGLIGLVARTRPDAVRRMSSVTADRSSSGTEYVDASYRVYTFPQPVRFLAMEHALPLPSIAPALRELRGVLRRCGRYSPYSVLVRVGAGDDAPLSPAYGRLTGYVNLTVPRTAGYTEIFRAAEQVLREHSGRPHWGKSHTATAEVLEPRYPEWATFQRVRAALDPTGLFGNDYVDRVLGRATTDATHRNGASALVHVVGAST